MHGFNSRQRIVFLALLLATFLIFNSSIAFSQATSGSIAGTVTDPSGAVVPGALVKIIDDDTGVSHETTSNQAGLFAVPKLVPGSHTVRVSAQGFKVAEFKNVMVLLGVQYNLAVTLEVGRMSESVEVEAAAPIVETSTAQTTTTFQEKKVTELPAITGRLDSIALLAPGVIPGFGNVNSNGAQLSVNGQRSRSNNFTIDGQDNNDNSIGGPGLFLSNIDVVQEFSIITNNFSAEYGRNQGAIVNIVTRSGTNQLHGAIYGFHQNSAWFANSFDNNRDHITKPRFNDNTDGATIGGPFKKDKAFFFFNFQSDQSKSISNNTSGVSSFVITPAGLVTLQSFFPNSNTLAVYGKNGPFAQTIGNPSILPGSAQTRTIKVAGVNGGNPIPFEVARITRNTPTPSRQYDWGAKLDFHLSSKTTMNWRYLFQDGLSRNALGSSAGYEINIPFRSQNLGVTITRQLSNRQINEFRFNYGRLAVGFEGANTFKFGDIGKNITRFAMPSGFLSFGLATNLPQNRFVNTYQYVDNWSMQVGRHFLKAGVDFRRQLTPVGFLPQVNGQFSFANISNFVRNIPRNFSGAAGDRVLHIFEFDQYYYFQDDFKIRPNLTLNLGIRYENTGQPLNVINDITVARESNPATALWDQSLPLSARTAKRLQTDEHQWAPRFGFAYTPKWGTRLFGEDKTVIRGGFSIAYDPAFFNLLLNASTAAPVVQLYTLTGVTVPATDVTGSNLSRLFAPPRGVDPRKLNQTQFDDTFHAPYAENWTFGIQRQIRSQMALEVRYAGSRGVGLFQTRNGNPNLANFINAGFANVIPSGLVPAPNGRVDGNFNLVRIRANTAASVYHGLQSRFDGHIKNQLTIGTSYTYSHNLDNVSEVFNFLGSGSTAIAQNPFNINSGERGSSNIDLRHAWSLNFIWEVPWLRNQPGILGKALGGWEISGIYRWTSGRPMTPVTFFTGNSVNDINFNLAFFGQFETTRPFVSNPNAANGSVGQFTSSGGFVNFVTGAPTTPNAVQFIVNDDNAAKFLKTPFGIGRNTFTAPRFSRGDFAMFKNTKFKNERYTLQFRWEVRNVFNTPFLGTPDLFIDDAGTTFFDPAASAGGVFPRQMTFGFRFIY